jgi:hypothetical protein
VVELERINFDARDPAVPPPVAAGTATTVG